MKRKAYVVTVFGSARPRFGEAHYAEAHALGTALASKGFVVCSGGYAGVMEAVSRGAKEAGGSTIGVTAKALAPSANPWIDEEIKVKTWEERLFELVKRGHGYVVCRGGTGTLAELAVVWEMLNKGLMSGKPVVAMGEFWQPVIACVAQAELSHFSAKAASCEKHIQFAQSAADAAIYLAAQFERVPSKRGRRLAKEARGFV